MITYTWYTLHIKAKELALFLNKYSEEITYVQGDNGWHTIIVPSNLEDLFEAWRAIQ